MNGGKYVRVAGSPGGGEFVQVPRPGGGPELGVGAQLPGPVGRGRDGLGRVEVG